MTVDIAANLERIRNRIADAGGDPEEITIVGVTKGHDVEAVRRAIAAGLIDLGENYAQELVAKTEALAPDLNFVQEATNTAASCTTFVGGEPRWHFIGQVQRNKVRQVAHLVHLWQSVDRLSLGREIANRAAGASVLVQVNLTDDPARGGAKPAFVPAVVDGLLDLGLDVRGLMAVAPLGTADDAREGFTLVRRLADRLDLTERSMGMTDDLEIAIECGSTMVRMGTALFGPRFVSADVGK